MWRAGDPRFNKVLSAEQAQLEAEESTMRQEESHAMGTETTGKRQGGELEENGLVKVFCLMGSKSWA